MAELVQKNLVRISYSITSKERNNCDLEKNDISSLMNHPSGWFFFVY